MRFFLLLALGGVALFFSGCATVISSPLQKVAVRSNPAGAEVRLDGIPQGSTPLTLEMGRWDDHKVAFERPGLRPEEVLLTRHLNRWFYANVFNAFILGFIVDASTGAMYKLEPTSLQVELESSVRREGSRGK